MMRAAAIAESSLAKEARGLRAANRELRTRNASLEAQVASLLAQLAALPPTLTAPPPPPSAPSHLFSPDLPVELWVTVCSFLEEPLDLFNLAKVCLATRDATRSRGAWREVSLDAFSAAYEKRHEKDVFDLTSKAFVASRDLTALHFAEWFCHHPAAASGITKLVLPHERCRVEKSCAPLMAVSVRLLPLCASLRRLLNINKLPHSCQLTLLKVAVAAQVPLEHVHLNALGEEMAGLLHGIKSLRSLVLTFDCTHDAGPLHIPAIERLITQSALTSVELDTRDGNKEIRVESSTLVELEVAGKGLELKGIACPNLKVLRLNAYSDCETLLSKVDEAAVRSAYPQLQLIKIRRGWKRWNGEGENEDDDFVDEDVGGPAWQDE